MTKNLPLYITVCAAGLELRESQFSSTVDSLLDFPIRVAGGELIGKHQSKEWPSKAKQGTAKTPVFLFFCCCYLHLWSNNFILVGTVDLATTAFNFQILTLSETVSSFFWRYTHTNLQSHSENTTQAHLRLANEHCLVEIKCQVVYEFLNFLEIIQ